MWGKEFVEKEGLGIAEKVGLQALERFAGTNTPISQGLVSVIVDAVTKHVEGSGNAPDVGLLKTAIGQLIEGTVGVLQATGKITARAAKEVEKVAVPTLEQLQAQAVVNTLKSIPLIPPAPLSIG